MNPNSTSNDIAKRAHVKTLIRVCQKPKPNVSAKGALVKSSKLECKCQQYAQLR